jgi:general L-amino acid transport system permease protein
MVVARGRAASPPAGGRPGGASFWYDPRVRAIAYQVLAIGGVIALGVYLVDNTLDNLNERQIRTGFGFLGREAGFEIGESVIEYDPHDSYAKAFVIGLLNTIKVSFIAIVLATLIGTVVGIARLSRNWLVARFASFYIETVRNMPLLLQLFFWYAILTGLLPAVSDALELLPGVYLSKSGLIYPVPVAHPIHAWIGIALAAGIAAAIAYARYARSVQDRTGVQWPLLWPAAAMIVGLPLATWLIGGAPTALDVPVFQRFRYAGGGEASPEFLALLLGLTVYTATFIAEVVRAGILAVDDGQSEAARALGLRQNLVLRLVVLPQALRVIIPPLTNQYLNLTKNSSLAVAIGYPDLVGVADTTLNQTGQAVEVIAIIMAVYLTLSLSISFAMNLYNRAIALRER